MSHPVIVVSSSSDYISKDLIKGIVKDEPAQIISGEATFGVLWTISNKYYNANVCLISFPDGVNPNSFNQDSVEAVIIYVKNLDGESLVTADQRKQVCSKALQKSETNILLCDKCNDTFPREQATVWCLENDFELIELEEQPDTTDETSPIKDHYGMERVIHTLHTNVWSNHQMHDVDHTEDVDHIEDVEHSEVDDDDEFFCGEPDDLEHMDEFCRLFSQMSSASENASSMPSEGRKAYAEQVVKAFWKAIGGDESELEDNITNE